VRGFGLGARLQRSPGYGECGAGARGFASPLDCRRVLLQPQYVRSLATMANGVVKKIVSDRGFGFISGEHGDVFFHHSVCEDVQFDDLQAGEAVQYEVDESEGGRRGGKGPRAASVRRS
jgi:CspA family cold shock protein